MQGVIEVGDLLHPQTKQPQEEEEDEEDEEEDSVHLANIKKVITGMFSDVCCYLT